MDEIPANELITSVRKGLIPLSIHALDFVVKHLMVHLDKLTKVLLNQKKIIDRKSNM